MIRITILPSLRFFLFISVLLVERCDSFSPTRRTAIGVPFNPSKATHAQFSHFHPTTLWSQPTTDTDLQEIHRPDPSILLSAQDENQQKLGVAGIGAGVLVGTLLLSKVLFGLDSLSGGFTGGILDFAVPVPVGALYAILGATHFFYKDGYAAVVPPNGTWGGLWNVPAPGADKLGMTNEAYHVLWTGVAEMGGGLLFALGGLNVVPIQIPAFLLFLLTLAVTPSNIYMFTHDVQMSFAPPFRYPEDHIGRAVLQIVLLSLLWYFSFHP